MGAFAVVLAAGISFALTAYAAKNLSAKRKDLFLLKTATTFCQCAQLTTLVTIRWPTFVTWTIPFSFPFSDSRCILGSVGWTQWYTFYAVIYIPILGISFFILKKSPNLRQKVGNFFRGLICIASLLVCNPAKIKFDSRIIEESDIGIVGLKERADVLVLLLLLAYSPLLQILGSVYRCFEDDELGWVLVSDPNVSCETGFHRTSVVFHVVVVGLVVGVGFPVLIYVKTRGELDAKSPFAQIFENYKKKVPYWEAIGLARKMALIVAMSTNDSPIKQAAAGLAINAVYSGLFEKLRPMVKIPSSIFKGSNLFHLVERCAGVATIIGGGVALAGSLKKSGSSVENVVGAVFAGLNFLFVICLIAIYYKDTRRTLMMVSMAKVAPLKLDSRRQSLNELAVVGGNYDGLLVEIAIQKAMIGEAENDADKHELIEDGIMLLSKLRKALEEKVDKLGNVREGKRVRSEEDFVRILVGYENVLEKACQDLETEFVRMFEGVSDEEVKERRRAVILRKGWYGIFDDRLGRHSY